MLKQRVEQTCQALEAFFAQETDRLARLCRQMAERFQRGGRLLVLAASGSESDAAHLTVEFMHPVLPGKRALPALLVSPGEIELARPEDIVFGLAVEAGQPWLAALDQARTRSLLTVAFAARFEEVGEWYFPVQDSDPMICQEIQETAYHVLWELVHVFLDPGPESFLLPFQQPAESADPLAQVVESTRQKVAETVALRRHLLDVEWNPVAACLVDCFRGGGTLFTMGNGGSATDAHDLALCFRRPAYPGVRALPAYALSEDWATMTALANDVGYERVFSRQLSALARRGDVLLGFTTSGGSANLLTAFERARQMGISTIALGGSGGGHLPELKLDHLYLTPSHWIPRIQEAHASLAHSLWHMVHQLL